MNGNRSDETGRIGRIIRMKIDWRQLIRTNERIFKEDGETLIWNHQLNEIRLDGIDRVNQSWRLIDESIRSIRFDY